MDITNLGHSAFRIKGKTVTLVTDPYDSDFTGLKFPKHIEAQIVTVSHSHKDHNSIAQIEGKPFVVSGPGEYEIKGVSIGGLSTYHDATKGETKGKNTVYRIEMDNLVIVHLGDLGAPLTTSEVEYLDGVDILFVPVGGEYTIAPAEAVKLIGEIEPSVVIPMHYGRPDLNTANFPAIKPLSDFLKEFGKEEIVPQPKLTISKDKIPAEMQIIVLS